MGYLEAFNLKIYRLKEENSDNEFLLYYSDLKKYNQYNKNRLRDILIKELEIKGQDILELARIILDNPDLQRKEFTSQVQNKVFQQLIDKEYQLIDNVGYKPIKEEIYIEEDNIYFNTYKMSPYLLTGGIKGDFNNIQKLLMNLCGNNEEQYNYFNEWIAWILQNPLKRLKTSIVFKGEQSSGKTKFSQLVLRNIFGNNYQTINQNSLDSEFNYYMMGSQLIMAEEVIHKENKFNTSEKLKDYTSNEWVTIRRMYKNILLLRNYTQWIFISNNHIPLKLDSDDTRYNIFFSSKLKNGTKLIGDLIKNLEGELNAYVYYLFHLKLDFDKINVPFENNEREKVIRASWNNIQEFLSYVEDMGGFKELNSNYCKDNPSYTNILNYYQNNQKEFVLTQNLYNLYDEFCYEAGHKKFSRAGFTRELNKLGYDNGIQRIDEKPLRVVYLK